MDKFLVWLMSILITSIPMNELDMAEVEKYRLKYEIVMEVSEEVPIIEEPKEVIYDPYNLSLMSNITVEELNSILADTNLNGLAQAYVNAEEEYNVNALFLVGLTILESGWGKSTYAINYNNLAGIYSNGRIARYNSKEDCISSLARLISKHYLDINGQYHNGNSIWNVNEMYCESNQWSDKINTIIFKHLLSN